jgi:hypothetical protein
MARGSDTLASEVTRLYPLDFFWRYATERVFIPKLPRKLTGLKESFPDTIVSANANMFIMQKQAEL